MDLLFMLHEYFSPATHILSNAVCVRERVRACRLLDVEEHDAQAADESDQRALERHENTRAHPRLHHLL